MDSASPCTSPAGQIPATLIRQTIRHLDFRHVLKVRGISKAWRDAVQVVRPLRFPAAYHLPVELVQQILVLMSPVDFNNARRTCMAWYISSLNVPVLRKHLETMGFSKTDPGIVESKNPTYLSMRLSRECSLGADGSGRCGLRNVAVFDLSEMATATTSHFTVSTCNSHVLLCDGCVVHAYRLQSKGQELVEFVATIICPRRVIAVSMDTRSGRYSVAVLLDDRMGLVHDIVEQEANCTYQNLCNGEDPPQSVAICPQRRCVAFGCQGGIELHWVDALTGQDLSRWFPLTAPTDFLYFLPPRHGIDSIKKLRLISSAVHPQELNPLSRRFGFNRSSIAHWGTKWKPRTGQSDHFQAVPLSDGYHILFTDPATGNLCLGSNAPLGGPTKLLRKIWLIPPEWPGRGKQETEFEAAEGDEENDPGRDLESLLGGFDCDSEQTRASVYAPSADLRYGVRIAAGYNDRVIFFTVPPDVFRSMGDRSANRNGGIPSIELNDPSGNPAVIRGCYIGTVPGLVDLAVESEPSTKVYAFSLRGTVDVYGLGPIIGERDIRKAFSGEDRFLRTRISVEEPTHDQRHFRPDDHGLGYHGGDGSLSEIWDEQQQPWASREVLECEVV